MRKEIEVCLSKKADFNEIQGVLEKYQEELSGAIV